MNLKKAILAGVPILVVGAIIYWIGNVLAALWLPIMVYFPPMSGAEQWLLSFALSLALAAILGYGVELLHPVQLISRRSAFYKKFVENGKYKVVRIRVYQGTEAIGILEEVIKSPDDPQLVLYKVVVPNLPIPISGLLYFVTRENLRYTQLTPLDLFNQVASFGLKEIGKKIFSFFNSLVSE